MPRDSLSERDRLRLAELMRAPLIPLSEESSKPPKRHVNWNRPKMNWNWPKIDWTWPKMDWGLLKTAAEEWKEYLAPRWSKWVVGIGVTVLCVVAVRMTMGWKPGATTEPIRLQAIDQKGQLQIRWNPDADAIRQALNAKLFIVDGEQRIFVKLNSSRLRRGAVSYGRQSEHVFLRMAVSEPDGKQVEERASFVGARPVNLPAPQAPQLEASAKPPQPEPLKAPQPEPPKRNVAVTRPPATPAPAPSPAATNAARAVASAAPNVVAAAPRISTAIEHRARKGPVIASGTQLPFTCSIGDLFHKTDAPPGWNTFACRVRNVWSLERNQASDDRSNTKPNPNAANPTAKPAIASIT